MKEVFSLTPMGIEGMSAITRSVNGTVKYLGNVAEKNSPLMYHPAVGETVVSALEAAPGLFPEARWIERDCDKLPSLRPMNMALPAGRHNKGYPAGLAEPVRKGYYGWQESAKIIKAPTPSYAELG
jgi:hypothetical protein